MKSLRYIINKQYYDIVEFYNHGFIQLSLMIYIIHQGDEEKKDKRCHTLEEIYKQKFKYVWWIVSIIVLPYFWLKGQHERWSNPEDSKLLVVAFVSYFIMPLIDVAFDLLNGINYFPNDPKFGFYTILVTFLPVFTISEIVHI